MRRGLVSGSLVDAGWTRVCLLGVLLVACLASAAPAVAQPYVYVANQGSNNVSQYDATGGGLTPLTPATVAAGQMPLAVAVSADGRSVYVTNLGDGTVSQFDIGAGGALTPKNPATVAAGDQAGSIAVSPDGKSVYVGVNFGRAIAQFDVGSGGVLTPKNPATVPGGGGGIAVSSDGKSVYATDGFKSVFQYDVGVGGKLTPKSPAAVAVCDNCLFVTLDPIAISFDGKHVYGVDIHAGIVFQFDVGAGGALTLNPASQGEVTAHPRGIALSPDGHSGYVTGQVGLQDLPGIAQFDVGSGGTFSPKTPASVVGGGRGIAISPDGKSVYSTSGADIGTVAQFDVGMAGLLAPKTPPSVAAGTDPEGIAVTPLTREPTETAQCRHGGWRDFARFEDQDQCLDFVAREARNACLAERSSLGRVAFSKKYGEGREHRHALRRCINLTVK